MKKEDLRIVYMGTPGFAVESLKQLVEKGYRIAGVVTMPDKPAGRGRKVQYSPVKEYALSRGLPLLQPENLKDPAFLAALATWRPDLQIVVAFRMLPESVWSLPPYGTFNLHASLLPQYRGAAPINRAIMNGETRTGVTTFFLTHGMDTGKIVLQQPVEITDTDTAGTLHDKLMYTGAGLVLQTVDGIAAGTLEPVEQSRLEAVAGDNLKAAPKIFKDTCRIDWSLPVKSLYGFIRGLSPYPAAWTELITPQGEVLPVKIYESVATEKGNSADLPGTIRTDGKNYVDIAAADGYLRILSLQLPGKKRLRTTDFLRGFAVQTDFRCR